MACIQSINQQAEQVQMLMSIKAVFDEVRTITMCFFILHIYLCGWVSGSVCLSASASAD